MIVIDAEKSILIKVTEEQINKALTLIKKKVKEDEELKTKLETTPMLLTPRASTPDFVKCTNDNYNHVKKTLDLLNENILLKPQAKGYFSY